MKQSKLSKVPDLEADSQQIIAQWKGNIPLYLKEQLQLKHPIWEGQKRVCDAIPEAIRSRKPIFIASGHSLGKDFIAGCLDNWFLDTHVPSKVILTAPTDRQVKHIMYAECLSRYNQKLVKYGKAYDSPYIEIQKEEWFLIGFTTRDSGGDQTGGKFQGIRSPYNMCIIVTEAQSVDDGIRTQIDGVVAGVQNLLMIFMGNPTRRDGWFAKGLNDKKNNIVFHFSCLESPNYKQRKMVIPGLVSYEWVEDKRRRWGETDPRWISRVLGQVPGTSLNQTFSKEVMDLMISRHGFLSRYSFNRGVAVDSSGEGTDDNVFMSGSGGEVLDVYTIAIIAPSVAAVKAVELCKKIDGYWIVVDCDGIGIAVYQELCKLSKEYLAGIRIIKFHGSSQNVEKLETEGNNKNPERKRIFHNRRAEAAFTAKDRGLRGVAAVNPKDDYLIAELEADEWFENRHGEIQLIDKSDIKEKLDPSRSPGRADCWKMLQWAMEQEFKDETYVPAGHEPMQRQADNDNFNMQGPIPRAEGYSLQSHADNE